MSNVQSQGKKEATYVWLAIFVTMAFSGVAFFLHLPEVLQDFFRSRTSLPVADWIMLLYLFWLLGLHWVAYRDWRKEQGILRVMAWT